MNLLRCKVVVDYRDNQCQCCKRPKHFCDCGKIDGDFFDVFVDLAFGSIRLINQYVFSLVFGSPKSN